MAKKKSSKKSNDTHHSHDQTQTQTQEKKQSQTQEEKPKTQTLERQPTIEDASEKLQNLKNLNTMLLKEILETRQRAETLVHSKEALEAESTRYGVEKSELEGRLSLESDKNVGLEGLIWFLVRTWMKEMDGGFDRERCEREEEVRVLKSEVERERKRASEVGREEDMVRRDFDNQVKKVDGFRERLVDMKKRKEKEFEDKVLMLQNVNEGLLKERRERERDVEDMRKEKGLVESRLVETLEEIDGLKSEIEGIVRKKKEIERENGEHKVRISELDREVQSLNYAVLDLQREKKDLHEKVLELEKSCGEIVEKGEEVALLINVLKEENDEKERSIDKLMREKEDVFRRLEMAIVEVTDKEGQIETLIREKNEIDERQQEIEVMYQQFIAVKRFGDECKLRFMELL